MTVRVRLFAGLKYIVGEGDLELTLPAGATVATLRHRLTEEYPALEAFMTTYVCAIDEEVQPPERVLAEGELVEVIPPVAGG